MNCTILYVWTFPDEWPDPMMIDLVMIFEEDGTLSHRVYPITYHPFRREELVARMEIAGFEQIEIQPAGLPDRYRVRAIA